MRREMVRSPGLRERIRGGLLVLALVVSVLVTSGHSGANAADGGLRIESLTTEYAPNPLGIDVTRPRLSWTLESSRRGDLQTAYRVLVATSEATLRNGVGDVWDSGEVTSGESVNVAYGGPALASRTRYYWKVRVWDVGQVASAWSDPAWWETALLAPADWQAQWIGRQADSGRPDLEGARWIWYPEGDPAQGVPAGTRYFRLRFDVPAGREVALATLTAAADNELIAYLDGTEVARATDWTRAARVDVTNRVGPGSHVLAVAATNLGGPGGLIARLRIELTSGEPLIVDTTGPVKTAATAPAGWQGRDFADASWLSARQSVVFGGAPWERRVAVPRPAVAPAPLLRKEFSTDKAIARARVYVSGLGNYVLRLNGRRVGDRVLDPAYTEYEDRVLYSTYDVTTQLRAGPNALAVALGPGFYYYDAPKLLLQLVIDYTDGTSAVVGTDQSWRVTSGPTSFETAADNAVFAGESHDARRSPRGWDLPGFDASEWQPAERLPAPGGVLVAQAVEPVTVAETIQPSGVTQPKPGTYVVDLGRTLTGWIRLTTGGQAGQKIAIQYGEKLNADGTVNAIPNPGPRPRWQHDEYVLRGDPEAAETWEPSFTFKSFRYAQLDGLTAPPTAGTVEGREVRSAVRSAGDFSSSSPLYNKIHQATRRTIGHILLGFPALDPGHEKNGWAGDTQLLTPAMADNFGMASFLAKWLDDVRDSQRADGSISMIDPIRDGCCYAWAPEWTAAYPLVAWELYVRYADRRVLERHYDALTNYLRSQTSPLVDGIAPPGHWGDWASPGHTYAPEDHRLSATAYIYRQATVMADIARVLGHDDAADSHRATAAHIRDRFNATFLDAAAGRYKTASDPGYRQSSNALPLAFGMVPDQHRAKVVEGLAADVRARGGHLNTGILGTPALLEALTHNGNAELAYGIASQTTYPSWGEWLAAGADTLWEEWGLTGRSRNHPMHGTIDDWFFRDVAGLAPDPESPGYRHAIVHPHPTTSLTHAEATHDSPYGPISVAWRRMGRAFQLTARIPPNVTATVRVPAADVAAVRERKGRATDAEGVRFVRMINGYAEFRVESGSYTFISPR